ncbi:protein misato [Drosophila gunungcola]|uniref:protein misato n=1 Tax=Drosophila gunungcola TaxID=103775 RepID=UPI0022E11829|nr:protein misato [Drosophila gunungcola]
MDHTREILTFQFGTYANYVGAHFWNQQEANFRYGDESDQVVEEQLPNNDIFYREGINALNRTTYTPRLLSVDLAGTLGHIPVTGELYGNFVQRDEELLPLGTGEQLQRARQQAEESGVSTSQQLDVQEQPQAAVSEYQRDLLRNSVVPEKDYRLAETANSWADFLYARYHPRTLNILPGLVRDPTVQALGTYSAGTELWQAASFNDEFCDRIRLYVEECDGLQGFHVLFDIDDGFGGLAGKCLEHLNDEYSRASFVLPLHQPRNTSYAQADPRLSHSIRVVNSVLGYHHLSEQAAMFTPLSTLETIWRNTSLKSRNLPGLQWQADNLYQTSALLAAFLDTATLGYRLRQTPDSLRRFCERISPSGRKMTAAGLALPFGLREGQDLIEFLDQSGDHALLTQLTPGCEPGTSYVLQSVTARGIPAERLKRPREHAGEQLRMAAYGCDSVSHMLQLYYQCSYHGSATNAAATPLPLKTQLPFPYEMFSDSISGKGFCLPGGSEREPGTRVDAAPVLAALQNSTKLGEHLDNLHAQTHRVQLAKLQAYSNSGLERDDYESALDQLLEFRDLYADSQYL